MAIAKIKKLEIIGLDTDRDSLLALLQQAGITQLINIRQSDITAPLIPVISDADLLELQEAISYLATLKKSPGFLSGIAAPKPLVYQQELKEVIDKSDWKALLEELKDLRSHLKNLLQEEEKINQRKQLLSPWRSLGVPLDEIMPTRDCGISLGVMRNSDYLKLAEEAYGGNIGFFADTVRSDKSNAYLAILYLKKDFQNLEALLKNHHFNFVTLGHAAGTVEDNLARLNKESLELNTQIRDTRNKLMRLSAEQFKLMVIFDYLANTKKRADAEKNLDRQQFTFVLSSWIRQRDAALLEKEITSRFKDAVLFFSEPQPGEDIPVFLENKKLIEPFEFITQIYGMPKYGELDPTPFLAPFFFLYFGFCVSDVGYGIILALISWSALKKFRMGRQGRKFFRLFLFCGISTIFVGALTGSWFGNSIDLLAESSKIFAPLKKIKDALVIIDPLKEPTKLLGIALTLGVIQVWFGNIVAGIGNIKNKRYLDVILDQVPMLAFLFGLTGLALIFLKISDSASANLFKYFTLIGAIALISTQGRSEKGSGAKLFYGIYNLYNAFSGYLSDILSYSRLWALGLVTGVMASTINLIATQFSQILFSLMPWIDKIIIIKIVLSTIIFTVIFVFGHCVSFLMNLLGAFVHPVRLQFVEFFSKFFKSGGSPFKPFKVETKYVDLG